MNENNEKQVSRQHAAFKALLDNEKQSKAFLDNEKLLSHHYAAFKAFLDPYLSVEENHVGANKARDKLSRLTKIQFHELSTDVYDELQRRQGAGDRLSSPSKVTEIGPPTDLPEGIAPSLIPRAEFHPKRNSARQKLSSLPTTKFKGLVIDVFYELEKRYPQVASVLDAGGTPSRNTTNGPEKLISGEDYDNVGEEDALGVKNDC
ncbi:hypothetical protein ABW20_dc0101084 [Dactylellina cionopaga]|nr:hypothetical protein ABW20_dc0101084 [Dactylellina cionopaga]